MIMKFRFIILMLMFPLIFISCGNNSQNKTKKTDIDMDNTFTPDAVPQDPIFEIITSKGIITVLLYEDTPLHRDNFVKLASEGFYDNVLFHRVINGFMIQTGDSLTKNPANAARFGTGDVGYTIPAEITNTHTHKKGALAAARLGDGVNPKRESSGCQFYIVQDERGCKHLDGAYTIFGETLDGFDVIDKIASTPTNYMDCPLEDIKIITIRAVL